MTTQAVIISFPGHFFMTALCIQSLARHYPSIDHVTVIYDDLGPWSWPDLDQDLVRFYHLHTPARLDIVPFSAWGYHMQRITAGWWRQQCVKMCVDQQVSGDAWLVVDGDIIFESPVPIWDVVPVHCLFDGSDPYSRMAENYTDTLLALQGSRVKNHQGRHCITSSIPFRHLDRSLLASLRQHVEQHWQQDFVSLHADMLADQRIVAWDPAGDKMVLHEWDLIEAWRAHSRDHDRPTREIGSGYHVFANVSVGSETYRHSSLRDQALGRAWLKYRGLDIPDDLWSKSQCLPLTI